jgi:hypothetical protein
MTMTQLTPEEEDRRMAEWEARDNARWQEKADNAAALNAAGGLATNMTLRDHFAGEALVSRALDQSLSGMQMAIESYHIADAMLEARKTTTKHTSGDVNQMRSALKALFDSYKAIADSGDCGYWSIEDTPEGKQAMAALGMTTGKGEA